MKSRISRYIIVFTLIVLSMQMMSCKLFLRRSEEGIRRKLLDKTPIGATREEVKEFIAKKKYEIKWESNTHGFYKGEDYSETIGSGSMRAHLGAYWGIPITLFNVDVSVIWIFDDDDKLIEINVRKSIDGF